MRCAYLYLTLFHSPKTLGQEFAYTNMFHRRELLFLSKKRLSLLLFVAGVLPWVFQSLFSRLLSKGFASFQRHLRLQSHLSPRETSDPDLRQRASTCSAFRGLPRLTPVKFLPESPASLHSFLATDLKEVLFFFDGAFFDWGFRLCGIRHKNTFFSQENATNYRAVGWLVLLSWACKLALCVRALRSQVSSKTGLSLGQIDVPDRAGELSQEPLPRSSVPEQGAGKSDCFVCFDQISQAGVTRCGHVFCWDCIVQTIRYKRECPLCRRGLQISDLFPILNL